MKITNVLGSPRATGNSTTIAQVLLEFLQKQGMSAKTFELNKLSYRGCQGCMMCKTKSDRCVIQDDLISVLEEIRTSDVVVISSPVYFGEVTAQTKGLLDRFYSYYTPDYRTNSNPSRLVPEKKLVFIISQGNPDEKAFADLIPRYTRIFGRLGFSEIYPIRGLGMGPENDARKNETLMQMISETAKKIVVDA